jgi:glycosyltransferase involved in cell wall biosynthesis
MTTLGHDRGRLRVLHIGKFVPPPQGGIELHIDTLLRCLQPHVDCALLAAESPQPHARAIFPYPVYTVSSWGRLNSVTLSPGILRAARRLIRPGGFDILHIHVPNPWADLIALLAPPQLPVVMTWHSDIVRQRILYKSYRYIQRAAIARANHIVLPTPLHLRASAQLDADRVAARATVIPYGIDTAALAAEHASPAAAQRIAQWAAQRPIILTIGRHVYYKGYEYLLQAMTHLHSPAVLLMIGAGPLTPTLQAQAADLGITDRVAFWGEVPKPDLLAALHACDVFTLPSTEPAEAFGLASAEAMACAKPVVACDMGNGINYLHQHGQTSLLVPRRDPVALAAALDRLCVDPVLRRRLGQQAQARIRQNFSLPSMTQGMLDVYRRVLDHQSL